jgi:Lon protease-like protein
VDEQVLPLFPLQVVLFPESRLPLHIFEERYKVLIRECVREEKEFGVNLLSGGELSGVGCSAAVVAVLKTYEDGRMDIVVEGRRRYRLKRYDREAAPYLVGHVEFFGEEEEDPDRDLVGETVRLYNELVTRVYHGKVESLSPALKLNELSYLIAQKAGLGLEQRQQLLEMQSENERLSLLRGYLEAVLPKLERAGELERIIRGNGYLPRTPSEEDE